MQTLQNLTEQARRAYAWTSFDPEKRAAQTITEHEAELAADLQELEAAGIDEETRNEYAQKFTRLFSAWLSARSRTASPMITGPARFPTERNNKAIRSERRQYEVFEQWRERAKRAIIRKATPQPTFTSEAERYRAELESLKANHEKMKEANKVLSRCRKTGADPRPEIQQIMPGISAFDLDWACKFGFGLQNNLANIRRLEDRVKTMEAKEARATNTGAEVFEFDGFTVIYNHEADRLQIKHDSKPDGSKIAELKRNGYRWSPSGQVWQRQLTPNAIWTTRRMLGVDLKGLNQ